MWQLQLPSGAPKKPSTIQPNHLDGRHGYMDKFFLTDPADGAMVFFAPENGVMFQGSDFPRSELREMVPGAGRLREADWPITTGTHTLRVTLVVTAVKDHVAVGQVHLGTGGPSTKPLVELYHFKDGTVSLGVEISVVGGQTMYTLAKIPLGTRWSYVIELSAGGKLRVAVNGAWTQYATAKEFQTYRQYFKVGAYNQSVSNSSTVGAVVKVYDIAVEHAP